MAAPGLIVDRDGTLTVERGYITRYDDLEVIPGVPEALARARLAGWVPVLVSNQSAIGRGLLTEATLVAIHTELNASLDIGAAFHCPHLPEAGCLCRKPRPGLLDQAIEQLDLDRGRSAFVGDNITDVQAALAAGVRPILVRTGHGRAHEKAALEAGAAVVDDLTEAVTILLEER